MATRANPYGVTTALRSGNLKIDPQLIADFQTLGLGWVRIMTLWQNIEKSPGVYDATALDVIDDAVHRCNQAGLRVQFPIQQPPSFHKVSTNCCPSCSTSGNWFEPDPVSVGVFAAFLANRYNGITNVPGYGPLFVDSFEVGNEEYDNHFCKGCAVDVANQPCRLAKWFIPCLQEASPKIRIHSPNSSIGMAALWWEFTPHHQEFMNDMYATPGISTLFDYANIHFYSHKVLANQDTGSQRLSLGGQVNEIYNIMAANGDGKKNVWVTEWGYSTADMTDQTRITYMNTFLDVARTNTHVGVVNYFTMNYVDPAINAAVQQFSLTQFNAPHYTQSFSGYQNYITAHPPSSWPSGGGTIGNGGGGGGAAVTVTPSTLTFTATVGGSSPASQVLTISNTGTVAGSWALTKSASAWLSASTLSGSLSAGNAASTTLSVSLAGLVAGTYSADVTITLTPTSGAAVTATCTVALNVSATTQHLFYVITSGTVYCYDMDNSFALLKQVNVNQLGGGIRGCACDPSANALYLAYGGDGPTGSSNGGLLSYNLLNDTTTYAVSYNHGIDQLALSPDGTTIYMPDGELSTKNLWHVVNAATGAETGATIAGGTGPHNTLVSLDGTAVYMGPRFDTHLYIYNIAGKSTRKIGPVSHGDGIRPFTINKAQTLAFITMSGFLGFDVWDIVNNKLLYTVSPPGFSGSGWGGTTPCHGISLSPDESEVWLLDAPNAYVHVFSVSGLPGATPTDIKDIALSRAFTHNENPCAYDCTADGWLLHSLDGKYVFVGDEGDVLDTATRSLVVNLPSLYNTRHGFLEVEFSNGQAVATSTHFGLGYGTTPFPCIAVAPTALTFSATVGSSNPSNQSVVLTNCGPTSASWSSSISYGAGASGWLTFTPTSGSLAASATVALPLGVTLGNLAAGTYSATVLFSSTAGGETSNTTLTVTFVVQATSGATVFANPGDNLSAKVSALSPGDTLVLNDGTYKEAHGLLVSGVQGTATKHITIRANNDGKAIIDGGGSSGTHEPCFLSNSSWIDIAGLVFQNSFGSVVYVWSHSPSSSPVSNITFRRCTAHGTGSGNVHVWNIFSDGGGTTNVLLEDCAGWGPGRYMFSTYHCGSGIIFRRCYGYWNKITDPTLQPRAPFNVYGTSNALLENCIGLHAIPYQKEGQQNYFSACWQTTDDTTNWPATNNQILGSIFYNNYEGYYISNSAGGGSLFKDCYFECPQPQNTSFTNASFGEAFHDDGGAGSHTITNCTFNNSVMGLMRVGGSGSVPLTNCVFTNNTTAISNDGSHTSCDFFNNTANGTTLGASDTTANPGYDTTTYGHGGVLFLPNSSPLKGAGAGGADIGANILYQYVNGTLTTTPLWPWPMESRIVAELGISVTYDANAGLFTTLAGLYSGTTACGGGASAALAEAGAVGVTTGGNPLPHICIVALENHGYDSATGAKFVIGNSNFPTLNAYFKNYGAATKFYGLHHDSLPNYLGFGSGIDHSGDSSVNDDSYNPSSNPFPDVTLVEKMASASPAVAWRHYAENLPSTGYLGGDTSGYVQHHNPWVYFKGVRASSALASNIVNYSSASVGLAADLAAGTAPPFFFVQPNNGDNGHSGTDAACDAWVKKFVTLVQASTWYTQGNGNILLWFDESNKGDTTGVGDDPNGGHVYVVVINAKNNGAVSSTAVNTYGLLGSIERAYNLPLLGDSAHTINGTVDTLLTLGGGGGGGGTPGITVSPASLSMTGPAGGPPPSSQAVTLTNVDTGNTAPYTTTSSQSWLTVSPTSGTLAIGGTSTSTITATIGTLVAGTYTGTITYRGATTTAIVTVTLVVAPVDTGVTPLTAYLSGVATTALPSANRVFLTSGGTTSTTKSSLLGTARNYGELYSQGNATAWAGSAVAPAPSGHGWLFDTPTLEGHDLQSGTYRGTLTLAVGGSGAQMITADVHLRAYKRSTSGVYTLLGDALLTAINICPVTSQVTVSVAVTHPTSFLSGDRLYVDALLNVTANSGPAAQTVVVSFLSTDTALLGFSQASLSTPGYAPTQGGPPPPPSGSLPGQFFVNGVSNYLFGTNMSTDFTANTVRNTPAIQSQIKSGGFTVMRCAIPDGSTDAYIDLTANACLACGCQMLVVLNHADNVWNQHVVTYLGTRCLLYEFGNEPDCCPAVPLATYTANWNSFIPVLRAINPNAAFIGPALGVFANLNSYLVPWLQSCQTSGVFPSAVSWHDYPCTSPACDQTCCTPLSGNFQTDASTLRAAISAAFGVTLPICLSEWNIDASNPMKAYATQNPFVSTWVGAAIDSMVAGKIDLACQWDAAGSAGGGTDDLISTQAPYPQQVEYAPLVAKIAQYLPGSGSGCPPNCPPPGITPLSTYGSLVASTTLPTAGTLVTLTGAATETLVGTALGQATGYGDIYAQGTTTSWPSLGALPATPHGNGWLLDEVLLEGQTLASGDWTPQVKLGLSGFAPSSPPGITPLVVYGTSSPSPTLPSAGTLASTTGGTIGHSATQVGKAVRYGELFALGTTATWPASATLGSPSGHGFLWDVTTLEAQQLTAGNWQPTVRGYISTLGGSIQADIYLRAYKYSIGDIYTPIGTFALLGQTISRTSTNYTLPAQALSAMNFAAGEKLYVDVWLNITTNSANDSTMHVNLALSTVGGVGLTNEVQVVTPGYLPRVAPPRGGAITADILLRVFLYNSGSYTPVATFTLPAQTISGAPATFVFSTASLAALSCSVGDKLYASLWLNVTNNTLVSPGLAVNVALSNLSVGIAGDLAMMTPGYSPQGGVVLTTTPPSLTFSDAVGGSGPVAQTLTLSNTRTVASPFDVHTNTDWLFVTPTSGTVSATSSSTISISVETGTLAAGTYSGIVSVLASGGITAIAITFTVLATSVTPCGRTPGQWQFLLACQDITNYVDPQSIVIDDTMGSQSATGKNIPIASRAGTIGVNTSLGPMNAAIGRGTTPRGGRPQLVRLGEVLVYDNFGNTVFGGYATKYTDVSMLTPNIGVTKQTFTTIDGIDYDAALDRIQVNENFVNQTDIQLLTAVFHKYAPWVDLSLLPSSPAYTFQTINYTNITLLGVLQAVQGITGYLAWVDYTKKLHYVPPSNVSSAPFALSDQPDFTQTFPYNVQEFIIEDTAAVNRVFFRGGRRISQDFKQDISVYANGTNTVFPLAYRGIHEASDGTYHVTINGAGLVVGLTGSGGPRNTPKPDGLADVILDPDAGTLTFAVAPASGAKVFATYRFNFPLLVVATDEKSHAFFGDPYMDGVINDTNIFDTTTALQRCRIMLSQLSFGMTTLKVDTWTAGLQAGQTLSITNAVRGIAATYLIQEVETEWLAQTGNQPGGFVYHVTCGAWNWNLIDVVQRLAASASSADSTTQQQQDSVEQVLPTFAQLALVTSWKASTTTTIPHIPPYYVRASALGDGHDAFPGFSTCG